jgi:membrane-associated phospholipid phosphatase
MAFNTAIDHGIQTWKVAVCIAVLGFLALSGATHTLRIYHWFLLLAIPAALVAAERGRRFFLDWAPLFLTWLTYDRLRLVQPLLLGRVAVEGPYVLERWLFGWLGAGDIPAHAARAWLAAHSGTLLGASLLLTAQLVYFSHLFSYPLLFLVWWLRSRSRERDRERFTRHAWAFAMLNALGFLGYVLFPLAPPWWVSLYGHAQPTPALIAGAHLSAAMDGTLVERMIATAPNWFAAFPSLHGGYPVLLFLLNWRERNRWLLWSIGVYGVAMWAATVVLNQHYIIDLIAGALLAVAVAAFFERRR